jgi:hypothetical protein
MGAVCRAPAISANEELISREQRLFDDLCGFLQGRFKRLQRRKHFLHFLERLLKWRHEVEMTDRFAKASFKKRANAVIKKLTVQSI